MTSGVVASDDPLAHQAYLGENQLQILRKYGTEQAVGDGDVLFVDGDHTYDLIVVLEGFVKVVEGYGKPDSDVIVTYGPNEFVGEMGLLTGQQVFLTGVASGSGRILRIRVEKVRSIMTEEPDLSDLILRAFLFRRALLTTRGSGLTLVGSRFCAGTRRLLELLARNRLSSRWVELEGSAEVEAWLQELPVPSEDLPIVLVPGHRLLRNPSNRELLTALGLTEVEEEEASNRDDVCDLLVVGGGPAGLAAAVYGSSEGLTTTLAEATALGGQAGTSTRIENLSFAKTPAADQVVDLPALMRRQSPVDDHPPAPLASTPPDPLRRPPPARPGEPRLAPATRRLQENGDPAQAARDGSPLLL